MSGNRYPSVISLSQPSQLLFHISKEILLSSKISFPVVGKKFVSLGIFFSFLDLAQTFTRLNVQGREISHQIQRAVKTRGNPCSRNIKSFSERLFIRFCNDTYIISNQNIWNAKDSPV